MPARQGKSEEIYKSNFNTNDFYKFYKNEYLKSLSKKRTPVDRSTYSKILLMYYSRCIEEVVLKNKTLRFTARLGSLKIFKREPEFFKTGDFENIDLPIDYNATLKLWSEDKEAEKNKTIVRHLNENSDGYVYFYKWFKKFCKVKNNKWYKFRATRTNKLFLSHQAKKNNVECFTMITKYYDKR
jgi:hypothetical protein